MGDGKRVTNRARRRQALRYQAQHGGSYTAALRALAQPRRNRRPPWGVRLRELTERCMNPGCTTSLRVTVDGTSRSIGELARIRAVSPGGPRHDPGLHEDSPDNMLVLCPNCHRTVDTLGADYPAALLMSWRALVPRVSLVLDAGHLGVKVTNYTLSDQVVTEARVELGVAASVAASADQLAWGARPLVEPLTAATASVSHRVVDEFVRTILRIHRQSADRIRVRASFSDGTEAVGGWHPFTARAGRWRSFTWDGDRLVMTDGALSAREHGW